MKRYRLFVPVPYLWFAYKCSWLLCGLVPTDLAYSSNTVTSGRFSELIFHIAISKSSIHAFFFFIQLFLVTFLVSVLTVQMLRIFVPRRSTSSVTHGCAQCYVVCSFFQILSDFTNNNVQAYLTYSRLASVDWLFERYRGLYPSNASTAELSPIPSRIICGQHQTADRFINTSEVLEVPATFRKSLLMAIPKARIAAEDAIVRLDKPVPLNSGRASQRSDGKNGGKPEQTGTFKTKLISMPAVCQLSNKHSLSMRR